MTIKSQISKAVHFFNPLNLDNRGGLLIPVNLKIKDRDYCKYRHLKMNPYINSLTSEDLPCEFSKKAVRLVDVFRRKTIDLDYEVMLIFDYVTSEIIYCFVNDEGAMNEVKGCVDKDILLNYNIVVMHNHPMEFGNPPSAKNFQILNSDFQDYEIISSFNELWWIESKNRIFQDVDDIKESIQDLYLFARGISEEKYDDEYEIFLKANELYGELLLRYINNLGLNIKIIKRSFSNG